VPSSLIHQEHGMRARCNDVCDFDQMQTHCLCVAAWQDEGSALAVLRTNGTEDVG
jgi:hypothetical protein